ncbi:hypothetical protein NWF32_23205 [Pseudomonas qingdaonensis]|nr:hypothetical protein [Pseudomonas qingdaonensis]
MTALPPSWIRSPLRALRQRLAARAHRRPSAWRLLKSMNSSDERPMSRAIP